MANSKIKAWYKGQHFNGRSLYQVFLTQEDEETLAFNSKDDFIIGRLYELEQTSDSKYKLPVNALAFDKNVEPHTDTEQWQLDSRTARMELDEHRTAKQAVKQSREGIEQMTIERLRRYYYDATPSQRKAIRFWLREQFR